MHRAWIAPLPTCFKRVFKCNGMLLESDRFRWQPGFHFTANKMILLSPNRDFSGILVVCFQQKVCLVNKLEAYLTLSKEAVLARSFFFVLVINKNCNFSTWGYHVSPISSPPMGPLWNSGEKSAEMLRNQFDLWRTKSSKNWNEKKKKLKWKIHCI